MTVCGRNVSSMSWLRLVATRIVVSRHHFLALYLCAVTPGRRICQLLRVMFLFFSIFSREFRQDDVRMIWITTFWPWGSNDAPPIVPSLFS